MNNKGFMMAEVVVVSAVILVTLTGLYISYNKILSIYNQRVDYYDVKTLYTLANYRDTSINVSVTPDNDNPILNNETEKIYYVNKEDIQNQNLVNKVTNQTFKDYIEYLSGSLNFDNMKKSDGTPIQNILVMERCKSNDNCKYAYLEVYD